MTSLSLRAAGAVATLLLLPFLTAESCGDERTEPSSSVQPPAVGGDTARTGEAVSSEVTSSDASPGPNQTTALIPEPSSAPPTTSGEPTTTVVTETPPTP
jgi:hypothetical protein